MNILYLHGYKSDKNAYKARQLQQLRPQHRIICHTLRYEELPPEEIQQEIRQYVADEEVDIIVGSSFGGYHALCASLWFEGPVWCINPVCQAAHCIQMLRACTLLHCLPARLAYSGDAGRMHTYYKRFDKQVFDQIPQRDGQLHFLLSTDDELLGSHRKIPRRFPKGDFQWFDKAGHTFCRLDDARLDF